LAHLGNRTTDPETLASVRQQSEYPRKLVVALCTFNGAHYIQEQIISLTKQTRLPDQLVVCDDASVDQTADLVKNMAANCPFPFYTHINKRQLGVRRNFEQVMQVTSGDIIFLCDQDDIWLPEKLETFEKAFEDGADWVCCDAEVVDLNLSPLGYTLWQCTNFNEKERKYAQQQNLFEILLKHYVVAGATIAFRANLKEKLLPIPSNWHYDAWLAAVLAATSKVKIIENPMQCYRQHSTNAIGGTRRGLLTEVKVALSLNRNDYYKDEINRWSQLEERLQLIDAPAEFQSQLKSKIAHLKRRAGWSHSRVKRLPGILAEISRGGYRRFARNRGSIAIDFLLK
jgi:glycosyltransferase involved in cell wall biosynthesis